ncbi:MAG: hypothetical protein E6J51_08805 [Chloroflexi bacterium]|nr:MAG: hypothetical protein E6J51_08805 [Chloroflexota bacterium]
MAPVRLRMAVGIGLALLGLFGALTGIFFTGMTPDGRLAQLSSGRILPSAVLLVGGVLIAATGRRPR